MGLWEDIAAANIYFNKNWKGENPPQYSDWLAGMTELVPPPSRNLFENAKYWDTKSLGLSPGNPNRAEAEQRQASFNKARDVIFPPPMVVPTGNNVLPPGSTTPGSTTTGSTPPTLSVVPPGGGKEVIGIVNSPTDEISQTQMIMDQAEFNRKLLDAYRNPSRAPAQEEVIPESKPFVRGENPYSKMKGETDEAAVQRLANKLNEYLNVSKVTSGVDKGGTMSGNYLSENVRKQAETEWEFKRDQEEMARRSWDSAKQARIAQYKNYMDAYNKIKGSGDPLNQQPNLIPSSIYNSGEYIQDPFTGQPRLAPPKPTYQGDPEYKVQDMYIPDVAPPQSQASVHLQAGKDQPPANPNPPGMPTSLFNVTVYTPGKGLDTLPVNTKRGTVANSRNAGDVFNSSQFHLPEQLDADRANVEALETAMYGRNPSLAVNMFDQTGKVTPITGGLKTVVSKGLNNYYQAIRYAVENSIVKPVKNPRSTQEIRNAMDAKKFAMQPVIKEMLDQKIISQNDVDKMMRYGATISASNWAAMINGNTGTNTTWFKYDRNSGLMGINPDAYQITVSDPRDPSGKTKMTGVNSAAWEADISGTNPLLTNFFKLFEKMNPHLYSGAPGQHRNDYDDNQFNEMLKDASSLIIWNGMR